MKLTLSTWLWLAQWRAQPGRLAVASLSIAIGVALALAIHLVNQSALAEFDAALAVVNGQAQARIEARGASFDEVLYPRVAKAREVAAASPVIDAIFGVARPAEGADSNDSSPIRLRVLGIDLMRAAAVTPDLLPSVGSEDEPGEGIGLFADDAIFPSPRALELLGAKIGDRIELVTGAERVPLRIAGTAPRASGAVAVMDLGTLQWRLGWLGRLSRIDLRLSEGVTPETLAGSGRLELPADVLVVAPEDARQRMSNLSRAYRVNLTVLALVALFTGGFIVHAAMSLAVARQQSDLALLGVLGASRRFILRQALGLGLLTGIAGSLLGLLGGVGGAHALLALVGGDLGGGYFAGGRPSLALGVTPLAAFGAAGLATALAGGLAPAWKIAARPSARALRSGSSEDLLAERQPFIVPVAMIALGAVLLAAPPIAGLPLPAYLAIALWLLGGIALVPHGVAAAAGLLRSDQIARAGPLAWLAMQRLASSPAAAGAAIAGIVASVALASAMAIMVTSFRTSVDNWLGVVLPADLYGRIEASGPNASFDASMRERIAATAGIDRVEFIQATPMTLDAARPSVSLLVRPIDALRPQERLPLTGQALEVPPGRIPIWVSEAMVDLYGWEPGSEVGLPVARVASSAGRPGQNPNQDRNQDTRELAFDASPRFFVAGVWRDYGRQHGAIVLGQSDWLALGGEMRATEFAAWLRPGEEAGPVAGRLREAVGHERELSLRSAGALREMSLKIFDRSFAVTWALEAIAIVVALFGVAAAWSAEALARKREFGMLRHIGIRPGDVVRQFALEAAVLASVAVCWGLVLGTAIALVLVHRVNPQSFHWTMDVSWPFAELFGGAFLLIALAIAVAALAARQASSLEPVRAVRDDW
jgi:putative ABC transport system permease protein